MDIPPGATVAVEIVKPPRRAAARKTLSRLCQKDPAIRRQHRRIKDKRPSRREWIRGGRYWHHQMRSKPVAELAPGRTYTIRATVDVLRELESVRDCVNITVKQTPAS